MTKPEATAAETETASMTGDPALDALVAMLLQKAPDLLDATIGVMKGMEGKDFFYAMGPGDDPFGMPSIVYATGEAAKPAAEGWATATEVEVFVSGSAEDEGKE